MTGGNAMAKRTRDRTRVMAAEETLTMKARTAEGAAEGAAEGGEGEWNANVENDRYIIGTGGD